MECTSSFCDDIGLLPCFCSWVMTPYCGGLIFRHFEEHACLRLQGEVIKQRPDADIHTSKQQSSER